MAGLTITPATGQQVTTQNPQTAPTQTIGASSRSGGVQPGTATSLLTSGQGVSLHGQALTTVSLAAGVAPTESNPAAKPVHHSVNAAFFIVPVVLCLIAAVLFWTMRRPAKSTTN